MPSAHAPMEADGLQRGAAAVLGDYQFDDSVRALAPRRSRAAACRGRKIARAFWRGARSAQGPPGLAGAGFGMCEARDSGGGYDGQGLRLVAVPGERERQRGCMAHTLQGDAPDGSRCCEEERQRGEQGIRKDAATCIVHLSESNAVACGGTTTRNVSCDRNAPRTQEGESNNVETVAEMTINEFLCVATDIKRRLPHMPDERTEQVLMLLDAVDTPISASTHSQEWSLDEDDQGVALEVVKNMGQIMLHLLVNGSRRSGKQLILAALEAYETELIDEDTLMGFSAAAEISIQRLINHEYIMPLSDAKDIAHVEFEIGPGALDVHDELHY
mgnify:CR=1 FL=1